MVGYREMNKIPFVLSLSKDVNKELMMVRQAHHERRGIRLITKGREECSPQQKKLPKANNL
jgi:hypothetical protein